jgi:L-asparaginase
LLNQHIESKLSPVTAGRVLSVAGNPETATFIRSALKPFQALAVTTTGTLERYNLNDRDWRLSVVPIRGQLNRYDRSLTFFGALMLIPQHCNAQLPRETKSLAVQLLW